MINDKLITTIFSSAIKTSLSQKKSAPKKKAGTANKKPSPTLLPPQNAPHVEALAVVAGSVKSEWEGWVSVSPKKKCSKTPLSTGVVGKTPPKTDALTSNAFYVPKKLEKKLHQANISNKVVESQKNSGAEDVEISKQKMLKSYRRHQARSRKRAKLREEKEKATLLEKKVSLLQDKATLHQQKVKNMTIADSGMISKSNETAVSVVSTSDNVVTENGPAASGECRLLSLPYDVLTNGVLSFLRPEEMNMLGSCSKYSKKICEEGFLWQSLFRQRFPSIKLTPMAMKEWKRAYQLSLSNIVDRLRCFSTQKTFMEEVIGVLVNFTVNPKTKSVDYIELSQDLLSETAYVHNRVRQDVFGNSFKLFLPLYFSEEHFQRALPRIRKTILELARNRQDGTCCMRFDPLMVLDVFPKIVTTFVVLLSDQGIAACRKSYDGLIRVHRLFLALAHQYPQIQLEAYRRLKLFVSDEKNRTKTALPNLGAILPLLMIVDQKMCGWKHIGLPFMSESFDRMVLWICKKYPQLERTHDTVSGEVEERVALSLNASIVSLRLVMFHVYFLRALCQGTTQDRANRYDKFFGQPEPKDMVHVVNPGHLEEEANPPAKPPPSDSTIGFGYFRDQINYIMSVQTWQKFLGFVGLPIPPNKNEMARRLRCHVANSRRKKYHTTGMDFSRIQASGTSCILSKGQQYSASSDLRRVIFRDTWSFEGATEYLDATCLLYKGSKLLETVDYSHIRGCHGAVLHSGDVMSGNGGSHTIQLDLERLGQDVTSCVFVLSAFDSATLADIVSPAVSFENADADGNGAQLCTYNLDSHDKVAYLTSVIMCRLYRVSGGDMNGKWHVQAIGDAHRGDATDYTPIYQAVAKLL